MHMNADLKSQRAKFDETEFYMGLLSCVICDVMKFVGVKTDEWQRDVEYINNRISCEGITFATVVLPQLGKAILSAFQSGRFKTPSLFERKRRSSALPAFLHGLTKRCFTDDGCLIEDAGVCDAVWGLQQICLLLKKLERPFTTQQAEERINSVKQVEEELPKTFTSENLTLSDRTILSLAREQVSYLLEGVDLYDINPTVGPGSTAVGPLSRNEKMKLILSSRLPSGYEESRYGQITEFGYSDPGCESGLDGSGLDVTSWRTLLYSAPLGEYTRKSRFHLVHKDSGGPRGICLEPCQQMWIQQGQRKLLEEASNRKSRGRINFTDQSINAELALVSSKSRKFATLDMKDASDRVSLALVTELWASCENVLAPLLASRSKHIAINEVKLLYNQDDIFGEAEAIQAKKFSPMGSAVCFPVESITFWSLAVATLIDRGYDTAKARDSVYVFGDDLIVPTGDAEYVMQAMERFFLRFNRNKCFYSGPFRESCGTDAFMGEDVTPIKVKTLVPTTIHDAEGCLAWVDYMNAFARLWMWDTSVYIERHLESLGLEFVRCSSRLGILSAFTYSAEIPGDEARVVKSRKRVEVERLQFKLASMMGRDNQLDTAYNQRYGDFQGITLKGFVVKQSRTNGAFDEQAGLLDWLSTVETLKRESTHQAGEPVTYQAQRSDVRPYLQRGRITIS